MHSTIFYTQYGSCYEAGCSKITLKRDGNDARVEVAHDTRRRHRLLRIPVSPRRPGHRRRRLCPDRDSAAL